jgi:hypothetical protein
VTAMSSGFVVTTGCDTPDKTDLDTRSEASEAVDTHVALCEDCGEGDVVIEAGDGGPEIVDAEPVDAEPTGEPVNPEALSKNPIQFLESVNGDFVNRIKGTPAISKQGFRFIQREFEITTESEVVEWSEDPLGCVVWAKATLPGGYSAEAHGEGYQFEGDVSDNEFVRYADTRAKNRAISDLTSAGALAVSELQENES